MLKKVHCRANPFLVMIDDIFTNIPDGIGRSLFADDKALWKRGPNFQ